MKKIIFPLLLTFLLSPLFAQTPFWHQTNGPEAGTVQNITIDSAGRLIVWTAGSGAYRSTDNGSSWQLLNRGLPKAQLYLGAATVSGYLIAANAAADGQLFRYNENDPNAQWVEITPHNLSVSLTVNDIVADPHGEIYLAAGNHGVFRSDDSGLTWTLKGHLIDTFKISPFQTDENTSLLSIDGNGNLFAGLAGSGAIYRSSDKGETWTKLPTRCPDGQKALYSFLAAPNGNIIIGTREKSFTIGGHIYLSTDTGRTWVSEYQRPSTTEEQKNNIDKLIRVPGTDIIYANAHGPTLRSIDNGLTWTIMDTEKRGDETFSMVGQKDNLFQMCEPDGVFLSTNNGSKDSWVEKNNGIHAEYMWGIAINSKQTIFGVTEYGLWGSTDNGDSWDHKPEYGEDYNPSIYIDKKDNIFIGTNKGLYRSKDDGQTLDRVIIRVNNYGPSDSLIPNIINQIGDNGHGKLFCASNLDSIGFLYSTDDGDHWDSLRNIPNQQGLVKAFAFASQDTILVASGTVGTSSYHRSLDGGVTWQLLPNNFQVLASQLLIHPNGGYLARVNGASGGIFYSNNGGQTWGKIFPQADQGDLFKDYYSMMVDHSGSIVVCTDSGVYRSTSSGFSQWYSVSEGLSANDVPGHFVNCVGIVENPVTHVFFAASHGLGVFKSIPSLGVSDNYPSAIAPIIVNAYPNPFHKGTTISFNLPQRESISLKVFDVLGREVQTLIQATFDEGEHTTTFDGSNLLNGNYMIVLREGDNSYTSWVTLTK